MIHSISGTVKEVKEQALVVDIGSLGLFLSVPTGIKFHQGQKVCLATYMHWNQEQGPSLFGFEHELERGSEHGSEDGCSREGARMQQRRSTDRSMDSSANRPRIEHGLSRD